MLFLPSRNLIGAGEPRPEIGGAFAGGYFQGQITRAGVVYDQISAPRSLGETTLSYSTDGSSPGPDDRNNGKYVTETILVAAKYSAARFCDGLSIGGFNDWFVPAQDQLELGYRNSKPTTAANSTSSGANPSSVPPRSNYTSGSPTQTSVALFQSAGSEAFSASAYWTITSLNETAAYTISFATGELVVVTISTPFKVRAWREQVAT